ncbi:CHAT domain-containing protein [Streptomyces cyaneofuscatus]|uniref:CHAT domain-containing protein n=1 Tax=Streptomyces cyaneofuscatus TaxID=66883 RepID=A0ABZ1F2E5_9ACTN|nr:CHAT domain-containing protein [Streptomyces cyaneofuscatus]WSB10386.1 CHAT domain-containing protein [Streptomyces cyaneofuscatus]WSD46081.1 CHAT domain-containing protein [Streptomyces cyaneofuscatus]
MRAVAVDGEGRPLHDHGPSRPAGGRMVAVWGQSVPRELVVILGRALFPPAVRRLVAQRMRRLGADGHLRLRLVLPGPEDEGPRPLGALRWEAVCVPSPTASAGDWDDWADEKLPPPDGGVELGRHAKFTLVREVRPVPPLPVTDRPGKGVVIVADATSVHGGITTRDGEQTVAPPGAGTRADADRRLVAQALSGSWLSARELPSPATAEQIRRQLTPGAGVFYFGGHQTAGGLVVAGTAGTDAAKWLDAGDVAVWLRDAGVRLAVLMACDSAGPTENAGSALSVAEQLVRKGVPHVVAVQGKVSHGQAADFAGRFFSSLAHGDAIDVAVRKGVSPVPGIEALPALYYTQRHSNDLTVGLRREAGRPAFSSVAHRLPAGDENQAPPLTDERFRVHLDAWWSLGEASPLDVLADPAGVDLVELLDSAEATLQRARPEEAQYEEPRTWYSYETPWGRLPRTETELREAVSPRFREGKRVAGRGIGLVVRCPAATAFEVGDEFRAALARLRGFGWDLRSIVVQVHGSRPDFVQRAAEQVARVLRLREYLVREQGSRGEQPEPLAVPVPPRSTTPLHDSGPTDAASALLAEVRAVEREGRQDPGPAPAVDVRAVVRQLNDANTWGDAAAESAVLRDVRAWWPVLHRRLLTAHALSRTGAARAESLRLAAAHDGDLDVWLQAAGGTVPLPADMPVLDDISALAESVVLGMVRTDLRDTAAYAEWRAELRTASSPVLAAVEAAEQGQVTDRNLNEPDTAVALERAGRLRPDDLSLLDPEGRRAGSWALVTRYPLDERIAAWLYELEPPLLQLAGLAPASMPYDLELEDQLARRRRVLRPPPPRL